MGASISPPTRRAMIKTGTYVGDDAADRSIDIGVDLASKNNVYVIIKGTWDSSSAVHRIEYGQGDATMSFLAASDTPGEIKAFTNTGFQIGAGANVNKDTYTYRWIAFWEEP